MWSKSSIETLRSGTRIKGSSKNCNSWSHLSTLTRCCKSTASENLWSNEFASTLCLSITTQTPWTMPRTRQTLRSRAPRSCFLTRSSIRRRNRSSTSCLTSRTKLIEHITRQGAHSAIKKSLAVIIILSNFASRLFRPTYLSCHLMQ